MQLIRNLQDYKCGNTDTVATIGNFDGVHLGHQSVIEKIIQKGQALNLPSMVIAFEPSAKEFFLQENAPARLTNFREKFDLISKLGVNQFVCLKFDRKLANMSAERFIKDILVNALNVKYLAVGDNFRFGKDRTGDFNLLHELSKKFNYHVEDTESFDHHGKRVSSTLIRENLAQGLLSDTKKMLGRSYSMSGRVIHGDKNGRSIGFPTANIPIKRKKCAVKGVYAVSVKMSNSANYQGVANIGNRPTVGGTRTQLEVHIFEFDKDIYGQFLTVTFCKKLRDEKKFESFDELKAQIEKDAESARDYFSVLA